MFAVRIHGRGGQGVVTGAELLSIAAFLEGRYAQAFPIFGSERTGAPVAAFCRIDDQPIRTHEPVVAPGCVIVQDMTLLAHVPVFAGLAPGGYALLNAAHDTIDRVDLPAGAATVPATELALRHIGRPVPNAALLGGFVALTGLLRLDSVLAAIRERIPARLADGNVAAARAAYEHLAARWLSTIAGFDRGTVLIEKMRLDDTGFPQPTGEFVELPADAVVLAVGQEADMSLLSGVEGVEVTGGSVRVGADQMTGRAGVFAGGDIVQAERTVTNAIGQGRRAAVGIDAYLRGLGADERPAADVASFERLNTWYYSDAPASVRPQLEAARRVSTFDEVVAGLDESTALYEARRCLSCGNCFECDNCYGVCPDNAIRKLGPGQGYEIDYDYCKGCGLCVAECPAGAIDMIPERF